MSMIHKTLPLKIGKENQTGLVSSYYMSKNLNNSGSGARRERILPRQDLLNRTKKLRAGSLDSRLKPKHYSNLKFYPEGIKKEKVSNQTNQSKSRVMSKYHNRNGSSQRLQLSYKNVPHSINGPSTKPFLRNGSQIMSPNNSNRVLLGGIKDQNQFIKSKGDFQNRVLKLRKNSHGNFSNENAQISTLKVKDSFLRSFDSRKLEKRLNNTSSHLNKNNS